MFFGRLAKTYKGETNFTVANIITALVSMFSGIVGAMFILPEDMGVIQSLLLVATYASFLQLGVFNGINRNIAFYKVQGKFDKMQKEIDTSHTVSLFISSIGCLIGIFILVLFVIEGKKAIYIWSAVLLLVTLMLNPLTTHLDNTFRSGQQFGKLGSIQNLQSFIYVIVTFLPAILGYLGRILSSIINLIVGYFLRWKFAPYKHKGKGDKESLKDLVSVGFPLLVGGYLWSVFIAADRTFIATNFSPHDMGLYTISGYVITLMSVIPTALNTLLYPKAAARYGTTGNAKDLLPFWKKSILLFGIVLLPLCVILYFLLPPIVEIVLPKYEDGITSARISLLTCLTFISMGPSVIFGTLKNNIGYIIAVSFALGLFWLIAFLYKDFFCTIESVAWLRYGISLCLMIFTIIYSYALIRK